MFYEKTVLDNGVTVVTEHMDAVRSAALGFWVRVGSRDELPSESGMSHFMEHMLFKGTPTRTALEISTAFDALGAEFNAFTSREYTCFYTRLIDEHLPTGFELLADMLVNANFAHENIVTEREVVLEEIARAQDTPDDYVYDVFADAVFPTNTLGRPILGTKENVSGFDTESMLAYHAKRYTSENIVIAACGSVSHEKVVELASKYLSGITRASRLERPASVEEPHISLSAIKKDSEQAHIVYGMPSIRFDDPRRQAFTLVDVILGGGMSSRLFQEIREKRGLAYSTYAATQAYEDIGLFEMYAGTRPENAAEVIKVAREVFASAAENGITEEELERAKELACGNFVLGMESTRTHMTRLGRLSSLGVKINSIDETLSKYRRVTIDEANMAARELFAKEPTIAVVSPYGQDEIERMLK